MGVRPEELFRIVHEANMSKLWEDGKPRYRESDGKVIKPPTWQAPEPLLSKEIARQQSECDDKQEQ
jgi:predicted HAD superfamily Cof-like phosphohydrolase